VHKKWYFSHALIALKHSKNIWADVFFCRLYGNIVWTTTLRLSFNYTTLDTSLLLLLLILLRRRTCIGEGYARCSFDDGSVPIRIDCDAMNNNRWLFFSGFKMQPKYSFSATMFVHRKSSISYHISPPLIPPSFATWGQKPNGVSSWFITNSRAQTSTPTRANEHHLAITPRLTLSCKFCHVFGFFKITPHPSPASAVQISIFRPAWHNNAHKLNNPMSSVGRYSLTRGSVHGR